MFSPVRLAELIQEDTGPWPRRIRDREIRTVKVVPVVFEPLIFREPLSARTRSRMPIMPSDCALKICSLVIPFPLSCTVKTR